MAQTNWYRMCLFAWKTPVKVGASSDSVSSDDIHRFHRLILLKSFGESQWALHVSGPTVEVCWEKVARGYLKLNLSLSGAPLFSSVKVLAVCPYVMSPRSNFPLFPLPVSASISVLPLFPSLPPSLPLPACLYTNSTKPTVLPAQETLL